MDQTQHESDLDDLGIRLGEHEISEDLHERLHNELAARIPFVPNIRIKDEQYFRDAKGKLIRL